MTLCTTNTTIHRNQRYLHTHMKLWQQPAFKSCVSAQAGAGVLMAFRASRQVHTSLRAWRLPPSVIARQLHGSHACAEQLFNAERVKQYEKLNKVPDKESALKELDQLGKPGGKSVVEFYFGENNSASVIASVNTIAHPAVAEDELLLYATRKNVCAHLARLCPRAPTSTSPILAPHRIERVWPRDLHGCRDCTVLCRCT